MLEYVEHRIILLAREGGPGKGVMCWPFKTVREYTRPARPGGLSRCMFVWSPPSIAGARAGEIEEISTSWPFPHLQGWDSCY
jgi:hypothetical protein